jgi:hypothetical protein
MMLFGRQESGGNAYTASMEWISPDMTEKESYVFEPRYAAYTVVDAIPTGTPGGLW